ncbi:MAG: hypothetical protein Q4P66_09075, partial [Actinomycetaceae bacterium]|nr:hypothetical protein [Actinomycetaceae bacterium]
LHPTRFPSERHRPLGDTSRVLRGGELNVPGLPALLKSIYVPGVDQNANVHNENRSYPQGVTQKSIANRRG